MSERSPLPSAKSLTRDIVIYLPIKVLPAVSIVLLIFYLIRALPDSQYVQYSTGMTIAMVSTQLVSGWLGASVAFFMPLALDRERFIRRIVLLSSGLAVAAGVVAHVIAVIVLPDWHAALAITAVCIGQSLFSSASAICQAERRLVVQLWMALAFCVALLAPVWLFFGWISVDYRWAFWSFGIAYASGFLVFGLSGEVPNRPGGDAQRPSAGLAFRRIFEYGTPLSIWVASMLLLNSGEKFFLAGNAAAAAYLSMKDLLIGATGLMSMPLIMAVHPIVFRVHRNGGDYRRLLAVSVDLLSVIFGAFWCFFSAIGFDLIEAATSKNFQPIKWTIFVVLLSLYLSCLGVYFQKPLEIRSRTRLLAKISAAIAAIALILYSTLVPQYGYPAAAAVFLFSQILYNVVLLLASRGRVWSFTRPIVIFGAVAALGELTAHFLVGAFGRGWAPVAFWSISMLVVALALCALALQRLRGRGGW